MRECASCGAANDDAARFCCQCAAPFDDAGRHRERRLVTVLFCDLTESTALADRLDAETLQRVLDQYFGAVRGVVESHGGRVEKYIGDAVVAVFGIPEAHEDDAARAARAALDVGAALSNVNDAVADLGVTLGVRLGLQSGDIVLDPANPHLGAIGGEAFNTAARLQAAASPGVALVGSATASLLAGGADLEPRPPVAIKGRDRPEPVFALLRMRPHSSTQRTPFVGRERQLDMLRSVYRECVEDNASVLATVLGVPGIGKTRIVTQLGSELTARAHVLVGSTPTYGDAAAYAPVLGLLRSATETDDPDAIVAALRSMVSQAPDAAAIVDRLASLVGSDDYSLGGDTGWALRRLLECLSAEQPVVVIVEDVHFGGDALLDLLDRVAASVRGPVMVVCTARPELLDQRPSWGGGKLRSTSINLGPLGSSDADQLAGYLLTTGDEAARQRLTRAAEGNPLYLEQLAALVSELASRSDSFEVPPTLRALLAARLDRLDAVESRVLGLGAVEGRQFQIETVTMLDPSLDDATIASALERMEQRSLVSQATGGGWQFAHALIQDAATRRTPKEDRAALHQRLADHLSQAQPVADEVIGAHLERAARLRRELGRDGPETDAIEHRAGEHFAAAGAHAYASMDLTAAADLLGRAASLLPKTHPTRVSLLPNLGVSLMEIGRDEEAERLLRSAADAEGASELDLARIRIQLLALQGVYRDASDDELEQFLAQGRRIVEGLEQLGNATALAEGWVLLEYLNWVLGRVTAAVESCINAVRAAQTAGRVREQWQAGGDLGDYLCDRYLRSDDVARFVASFDDERGAVWRLAALAVSATGCAYRGDVAGFEEARVVWAQWGEMHGLEWPVAQQSMALAQAWLELGDGERAEAEARSSMEYMERAGDLWSYAAAAWLLPRALALQGRHDEALAVIARWEDDDRVVVLDKYAQIHQRSASALGLQLRGRLVEAQVAARSAVDLAQTTELTVLHTTALEQLADLAAAAGRPDDARDHRMRALELHESHGNLVGAARVRALLD